MAPLGRRSIWQKAPVTRGFLLLGLAYDARRAPALARDLASPALGRRAGWAYVLVGRGWGRGTGRLAWARSLESPVLGRPLGAEPRAGARTIATRGAAHDACRRTPAPPQRIPSVADTRYVVAFPP